MLTELTEIEARIVGCLVEKELTTPDYYPLTLNALVNACNQKSNRDPVVEYDESSVEKSLERLRDKNLVYVFYGSSSRVAKYKHMLPSYYELTPQETALVAVLMLRGAQTLGELKERSKRLYEFSNLEEVDETLSDLAKRDDPIVIKLERLPGQKDSRFMQLLTGEVDMEAVAASFQSSSSSSSPQSERISNLETEVENLKEELATFKEAFEEFKKQFE